MSESVLNGGGGEMKVNLTKSDTVTTLVSPTTPPSEPHLPLMETSALATCTTGKSCQDVARGKGKGQRLHFY